MCAEDSDVVHFCMELTVRLCHSVSESICEDFYILDIRLKGHTWEILMVLKSICKYFYVAIVMV